MSLAVQSAIDLSTARTLAARRLSAGQPNLQAKLDILRRVLRRDLDGTLPALVETRAEQSWNEQIFARVLGYQTLFSHDAVPYHLQPKSHAAGRYNDFSLGFFGLEDDLVLASAELKSPGASLDKPQPGYGGMTAVEQAYDVASKIPSCRWALVSNLVELRLYPAGVMTPLATAYLREVRSSRELAALLAHFDRAALLGARDGGEIAMVSSMATDHPAAVLPPADGSYRVIARFTPSPERERPLYEIERVLRQAVVSAPGWFRFIERMDFGRGIRLHARLKDGWVAIDGSSSTNNIEVRVAASMAGQVVLSARIAGGTIHHAHQKRLHVDLGWVVNVMRYFAAIAEAFEPEPRLDLTVNVDNALANHAEVATRGVISAELRDIASAYLSAGRPMHDETATNAGVCETEAALTGDMTWSEQAATSVCAACVCEFAIHFRDVYGGVGLLPQAVKDEMDRRDAHDRTVSF